MSNLTQLFADLDTSSAKKEIINPLPVKGLLGMTGFQCVVADPPWEVGRGPEWNSGEDSRPLTYPTLSVEEIMSIPVRAIVDKDAHLYLWTINKYIEQSYQIARRWGFRPVTLLTWVKNPMGVGLGGSFCQTTEHILFARRGNLPHLNRMDTTWWNWTRGKHSEKPEEFQTIVELVSQGPYLEMFARRKRFGWTTWGNEIHE